MHKFTWSYIWFLIFGWKIGFWILLSKFIISNCEWWKTHRKVEWLGFDALLNLCLNAIFHLRFVAINLEFGSSVCRLIFEIHLSIEKLDLTCLFSSALTKLYTTINSQLILLFLVFVQQFLLFLFCVCAILHLVSRTTGNFTPHDEHCCNFAATHHLILWNFFQLLIFLFSLSLHETKKRFFLFIHGKQSRTYVHQFSWMVTVVCRVQTKRRNSEK